MKYDFTVVVLITILVAAPVGYFAGSSAVSLSENDKEQSVETQALDERQSPERAVEDGELRQRTQPEPERIDVSVAAARELLGDNHPKLQEYQEIVSELEGLYKQYEGVSDPSDVPVAHVERVEMLERKMLSLIRRIF